MLKATIAGAVVAAGIMLGAGTALAHEFDWQAECQKPTPGYCDELRRSGELLIHCERGAPPVGGIPESEGIQCLPREGQDGAYWFSLTRPPNVERPTYGYEVLVRPASLTTSGRPFDIIRVTYESPGGGTPVWAEWHCYPATGVCYEQNRYGLLPYER